MSGSHLKPWKSAARVLSARKIPRKGGRKKKKKKERTATGVSRNRPTAEAAGKQSQQPQPTYLVRSAPSTNLGTGLLFRCGFGSREVPARPSAPRCARAAAARPSRHGRGPASGPARRRCPQPGRETEPPGPGPPPRPGPLTGRCEAEEKPASRSWGRCCWRGLERDPPGHRQHHQTGLPPSRRHKTGTKCRPGWRGSARELRLASRKRCSFFRLSSVRSTGAEGRNRLGSPQQTDIFSGSLRGTPSLNSDWR